MLNAPAEKKKDVELLLRNKQKKRGCDCNLMK